MKEFEYPENLIKKARDLVSQAENEFKSPLPSYSNVIYLCQTAIELSGKAIFKIMGLDFPREHQLLFEREKRKVRPEINELLQQKFPEYFTRKDEIPRVIFLTYFWDQFYTIGKYGIEEMNFSPDKLFEKEEAQLAINHANYCVSLADELLIHRKQEVRKHEAS
jgi:HEPN domain-containing protein